MWYKQTDFRICFGSHQQQKEERNQKNEKTIKCYVMCGHAVERLVLVRLPIPHGFNPQYLHVYYIASDGSGIELLDSYIDGDYICFETTHFSEYAIVDESPDQDTGETQESNCVCGKYHTGPMAGFIKFFHKIIYFFKNLFYF